jgi:hypothetical protein
MTHTPTFQLAITQFAVKNWPGLSGLTPRTLFTRTAVYAILSCLTTFSKPTNPIIRVYELANLFHCRHSKNRLFEFVCQYFESSKLIQFHTHRQNISISPLVLGENWFLAWNRGFQFICPRDATRGSKTHVHPLQHVLPAVTGPNTLVVVFYALGILLLSFAICTGPFSYTQQVLLSTEHFSLHKPRHRYYYDTKWHWRV